MTALIIAAALPLIAGCGPGSTASPARSPSSRPPTTPIASGPTLIGTVQTSEDVTLTAAFRSPVQVLVDREPTPAPARSSCADYAAGAGGSFVAPQFDVSSGDHGVYFVGMMSAGYQGPGVYSSTTAPSLGGTVSVAVGVGGAQQPTYSIFRSQINGTSTLTVHDDGSGTFLFAEWGSDEVRGNTGSAASISGTVTWTCQ